VKKILIAIDGYAACGKSTLAKQLASHLHYLFLDTGAMYRAVTLYLLDNNINWVNNKLLNDVLDSISITFQRNENGKIHCLLNGDDVEEEIRSMHVSNKVSEVAAVSAVRKFLVQQQQIIGKEKGIVMDGQRYRHRSISARRIKIICHCRYGNQSAATFAGITI
jgi:cytidylate kinase